MSDQPHMLAVFYPAVDARIRQIVLPGSAIVGRSSTEGALSVDFEGNAYGASGLDAFPARVEQAAGRHVQNYPTRARARVPSREVHIGAWYDTERRLLVEVVDKGLGDWAGEDPDSWIVPAAPVGPVGYADAVELLAERQPLCRSADWSRIAGLTRAGQVVLIDRVRQTADVLPWSPATRQHLIAVFGDADLPPMSGWRPTA